jgi:hypothetical protein
VRARQEPIAPAVLGVEPPKHDQKLVSGRVHPGSQIGNGFAKLFDGSRWLE